MNEKTKNSQRCNELAPIKVYCNYEQRALIQSLAARCDMSLSTFMLKIATSRNPLPDKKQHEELKNLLKINADLGRLGGLLKLWLSNDKRSQLVGKGALHNLLGEISGTQCALLDAIKRYSDSKNFNS